MAVNFSTEVVESYVSMTSFVLASLIVKMPLHCPSAVYSGSDSLPSTHRFATNELRLPLNQPLPEKVILVMYPELEQMYAGVLESNSGKGGGGRNPSRWTCGKVMRWSSLCLSILSST